MKLILRIAQNELRNLFFAPIAWVLTIIFMVLCGYFYTDSIYPLAKWTEMAHRHYPKFIFKATESLTEAVYLHPGGLFANVLQHIYLFVPLLTMSIINREINNGTIKLLYSSPVKLRQLVFGKYLAIMIYNLLLVFIVSLFIIAGFFDLKSLDYGRLLSALLGFYLLLCSLSAIGFFMSSLTTYPIVAAIASFTVLTILSNMKLLWQEYDFIRDFTWFLSITGRTEKMVVGLISSKDVIYYLVIIFLFIAFTILKLKGGRIARPWYVKSLGYIAVIITGLIAGYISSFPQVAFYYDATARNVNTIHPRTQESLRALGDSTLEVTLYGNLFNQVQYNFPRGRNAYLANMWEPYQRFKPGIKFKYEYYYDSDPIQDDSVWYKDFPGKNIHQIAALRARMLRENLADFKTPEQMRRSIDLGPEGYALVMRLQYGGRSVFLRTYPEALPDQQNVNAALKRLTGEHIPKIAFATGALERSVYKSGEREYAFHTTLVTNSTALVNVGFDVDTINLLTQDLPPDLDILVLADPRMELSDIAANRVRQYINSGGNMMILGEPRKQHVLNPSLQQLGIQLTPGQLVQPSKNETPEKLYAGVSSAGLQLSEDYYLMRFNYFRKHEITDDSLVVLTPGATAVAAVADSSFQATPLEVSPFKDSWLEMGKLVIDSVAPVFSAAEGDQQGPFSTALALTRERNNKEQRIIVFGDADNISNLRRFTGIVYPLYSWLAYNKFPVYTPIPYAKDNQAIIPPKRASLEKVFFIWILPGLLGLFGTVFLIRRRRK